ncbi:hypothetical protein MTR67_031021 [Solanum verrucosum]|uniref:Uncharacterized protein n=1 Tax=Solanum verrucosum TaxID=315347 RepID=A0AAF0ZD22_SOLVR|nr:hypothetical protein MTR67_031021 [Solanum verrucosum]
MDIFVEHTDEYQWTYDVVNIEGAQFQSEESLVDVNVIEESDATSEEYSTAECIGVNEKIRDNQFKEKTIEFGVASDMAKIPSDTQAEARQLNQPRAQPQIPLRSSAFILEKKKDRGFGGCFRWWSELERPLEKSFGSGFCGLSSGGLVGVLSEKKSELMWFVWWGCVVFWSFVASWCGFAGGEERKVEVVR